jgi:23S rRNA (adenine2503-C2)-methyltransferase
MIKELLCGLTADEILHLIEPSGYTISNAVLVSNGIYKKREVEISQIPKISRKLKDKLEEIAISGLFKPVSSEVSVDKSIKYLFRTESGKEFETVYIPEGKRKTVCVSTQSGCRMGCHFCVTAGYGFRGNLTAGEIVNQVLCIPDSGKVTHVVFMGMGEPFDNLENVLKACEIMTAEWGLAISSRNITVSTVGITPGIEKYLQSTECNLTLSLHSPFAEEREAIVPIEKRYPVLNIIGILKNYPVRRKRRISIAYIMIENLNDTDYHLSELISILKGSIIRVNLLSYHPSGSDRYRSSSIDRMIYFKHNLVVSGISASVRKSRGIDISAACGLLATGLK